MLPKITDEKIKSLILAARRSGNLDHLLPELPIWMAEKTTTKRRLTEDDRSEIILLILERLDVIWKLSLKYDISVVLGFFVTYAFNLFRNTYRKNHRFSHSDEFFELWQEKREVEDNYTVLLKKDRKCILKYVETLPHMIGLVICLRYDLPLFGNQRKALEWRLLEMGRNFEDYVRIYDKKKENALTKMDLYSRRIVRYTRLLLDSPQIEKRNWYLRQKKYWVTRRERAVNRRFFSEREVSLILGISRKETRLHIDRGMKLLYRQKVDLLHCA